jgi:pyruvate/2-oxoacid:ferredoxin oxidoreductase beta subunit
LRTEYEIDMPTCSDYISAMVRTQVQLTEDQLRKLRRAARAQGTSVAEVVRRCIERGIDDEIPSWKERYARAARLIGRFRDRDGAKDVSLKHDAYIDDAIL